MSSLLPQMNENLASLMQHSTRMQKMVYNDASNALKNVQASKVLEKLMTKKEVTDEDLTETNFGIYGCCL